jgi:hypothetical protein
MPLKPLRVALLILSLLGAALPWFFYWGFFQSGGSLAPSVFWGAALANDVSTAITVDVYLAALAFSLWVGADRSLGRWRWAYVLACFGVGLAFVLPLYWAQRLPRSAGG